MQNRPSIPAEISREVLVEAGHRCAVCGAGTPLERAHIVPWHKSKQHRVEDLICLCASCHQRADLEKWGAKTLREYKMRPWVLRQYEKADVSEPLQEIEITIHMEYADLNERVLRWLRSGLAGFLEISPDAVQIVSSRGGSVKLIIRLPTSGAERLLSAYEANDSGLSKYLAPLIALNVRQTATETVPAAGKQEAQAPSRRRTSETLINLLVKQLEEFGCTMLAEQLREGIGISPRLELAGSLDGYHPLPNVHQRVVSALLTAGLEGVEYEQARATVRIAFESAGITLEEKECDRLAALLVEGIGV